MHEIVIISMSLILILMLLRYCWFPIHFSEMGGVACHAIPIPTHEIQ